MNEVNKSRACPVHFLSGQSPGIRLLINQRFFYETPSGIPKIASSFSILTLTSTSEFLAKVDFYEFGFGF
jgi:hypothetical protein